LVFTKDMAACHMTGMWLVVVMANQLVNSILIILQPFVTILARLSSRVPNCHAKCTVNSCECRWE